MFGRRGERKQRKIWWKKGLRRRWNRGGIGGQFCGEGVFWSEKERSWHGGEISGRRRRRNILWNTSFQCLHRLKTKPVEMLGRCFWNADATQVTSCPRCRSGFHQVWLWISILRLTTSSATILQVWQILKTPYSSFLLNALSSPSIHCFTEGSNWKILKAENWIFTIFRIFKD